ncbi:hypothetical protein PIB30_067259 [Stylosanthes scabra]|uniref:Uncharacterized protein n=1 Tax=Stylosanthes scabra TaxID=79078 RepID=A0ABU6TMC2_9FABA|nr:hypothetical protein [Stylosanthes scabra]
METHDSVVSNSKPDDYHLSLELIEQARHLPGFNPMGVGLGSFSQVYQPSPENIHMAKSLHRQNGTPSSDAEPPDPGNSLVARSRQTPLMATLMLVDSRVYGISPIRIPTTKNAPLPADFVTDVTGGFSRGITGENRANFVTEKSYRRISKYAAKSAGKYRRQNMKNDCKCYRLNFRAKFPPVMILMKRSVFEMV